VQNYQENIELAGTKKVGSTGRYGARYGAKLRRRVLDIEKKTSEPVRCPACATKALKRQAVGLWKCNKCNLLFAGGAYVPFTEAGKAAKRAIAQRIAGDFLALREDENIEDVLDFLPNVHEEEVVLDAETVTTSEIEDTDDE
jgi:large subunit ribosomal protein L37Ae